MAGNLGRIARALVNGAMARRRHRALHAVGLHGWKGDLMRVLSRMASNAISRRRVPASPPRGPYRD